MFSLQYLLHKQGCAVLPVEITEKKGHNSAGAETTEDQTNETRKEVEGKEGIFLVFAGVVTHFSKLGRP